MKNTSKLRLSSECRFIDKTERGFTLVELMIAITLGLLILLALIAVFLNISRTNREMAKTNSQIENARFAIQILRDDISAAGFWGTYVPAYDDLTTGTAIPGDVPTVIPGVCEAYTAAAWNAAYVNGLLGIPVQSYDTIPAGCSSTILPNKKASTDVLVVRHAETCLPGVNGCEAEAVNKLYFQSSRCENEITAGSRYILEKQATPSPFTLKQMGCTGAPPAATVGTLAEIRKFTSSIYYIRDYARTVGDGIPTLMRSQFDLSGSTPAFLPATPLIEGIEGFSVELGIDNLSDAGLPVNYALAITWANPNNLTSPINRGDGIPDGAFVRCTSPGLPPCLVGDLTNVVAVKLHLLARAEAASAEHSDTKTYNLGGTALGPFNDKFKRHAFSTTVRLTNISGRRETP